MKYLILFITLVFTLVSLAQGNSVSMSNDAASLAQGMSFQQAKKASFEENKGQVTGEDASKVKYTFDTKGMKVFLLNDGIAYQFSKTHYPEGYQQINKFSKMEDIKAMQLLAKDIRLETYRMDVRLIGANSQANITSEGKSNDYTQYYNHGALDVHSYTKITYHNVYPNIDWVIYQKEEGIKYDFVVRPGGDPKQIKLETKWVEDLSIDEKGNLVLKNRMGGVSEQTPVSFQEGKEIETQFILKNNEITFDVKDYNPNEVLIIDPLVRVWGTYYGDLDTDAGYSCTVDGSGFVYLAGWTSSSSSISLGGHQNTIGSAGVSDAFLVKFTSLGIRVWGTYYGGSESDVGYYCAVDGTGNVYLSGSTESSNAIASLGHQNTYGGSTDAFLVKFNGTGVRQWSTYYGGTGFENGASCAIDVSGNVYLSGDSQSTSAISTVGSHQSAFGGGLSDAFLVKFNLSGVRQWATFYGGNSSERAFTCAVNATGTFVYLIGSTSSTASIAVSGHQNSFGGGGEDGFLVKFNSLGVRQWGTYYGGSSTDRFNYGLVDSSGDLYLTGYTFSSNAISSGGHQNTHGGSLDAFLVKFNALGVRQWATYYGGSDLDGGFTCAVDGASNVYMSGYTSTTAISVIASSGFQDLIGGLSDGFLVKFNSLGVRQWGAYYGGSSTDAAYSCAISSSDEIYLAGNTQSPNDIASGGFQNSLGGSSDAFLVKLIICTSGTNTTSTASICENATKPLTSSVGGGTWSVVSGGGTISGTTYTPADVSSNTSVTVRYTDGCGTASDVTFTVNVLNVANNTSTTAVCEGSTVTLTETTGGGTWSIVSGGGSISGTTYTAPTVSSNTSVTVRYSIAVNGACAGSTSDATFTVGDNLGTASNTTSTASICEGSTVALAATPTGGTWSVVSGGGTISGTTYTSPSIASNTNVTVRYTIAANAGCAATSSDATFTVNVNPGTANNTTSTASICEGSTVALAATPAGGTWSLVSGGGTISGTTYTSPSVASNTNVTVRYTIPANGGCAATTSDATFTVGDNLGTASNTTSTTSICEGSTVALAATPAGGTWSVVSGGGTISGTTYTSPSVGSNTNVTVRYTIPANAGCAATTSDATFTVGDDLGTASNTTSTASICEGSTVALAATPAGGTWTVVSGGGTISGTTYTSPSVASNTNVTVRYTIPVNGGCAGSTSDATFTVNVNPGTASNTTSTSSICEGSTVALAATPAGGTWSVVSGGGTISGTTYTSPSVGSNTSVTVRYTMPASGGCAISTSDVSFTVNDNLGTASNTTSTASICEGSTVALTSTPAGGTWTVVSGGGTISGTTYTSPSIASNTNVTVRYSIATNGACVGSDSDVTFTVNDDLGTASNTTSNASTCEGSTVALAASPAGGTWSVVSGGGTISGTTYTPPSVGSNTNVTVRYSIATNGACAGSDSDVTFTVNDDPGTASNTTSASSTCASSAVALAASPAGGTWSIISGGGSISGTTYTPPIVTSNTTITVRYTIAANGGCSATTSDVSFSVNDVTPPSITCNASVDVIIDASCQYTVPSILAEYSALSDDCSANGSIVLTQSVAAGSLLSGVNTVYLIATDEFGNSDSCAITLNPIDNTFPTITCPVNQSANTDAGLCSASVIVPNAIVADNCTVTELTWVMSGATTTSSPTTGVNQIGTQSFNTGTTTVTYTVADAAGNSVNCSFDVTITDNQSPIVTNIPTPQQSTFCEGEAVTWAALTITDNCGAPTVTSTHNSGDVFPIGTTTVTYTVTDASGNVTTQSFDVVVNPLPTVSLAATLMNVCSSESVTLSVTNPDSSYVYDWTFGNGPVIYTGSNYTITDLQKVNTGYYQVTATNSFGCNAMDEIHLIVEDCEIVVYQTFSPDNNGQNEYFFIEGLESFPNTSVTVLNRWGAEVYHSDDYKNDWHGTSESQYNVGGDLLPEGTYFYLLELGGDPSDDTYHKVYKGYVYLKR